jgi:hypothetical protein
MQFVKRDSTFQFILLLPSSRQIDIISRNGGQQFSWQYQYRSSQTTLPIERPPNGPISSAGAPNVLKHFHPPTALQQLYGAIRHCPNIQAIFMPFPGILYKHSHTCYGISQAVLNSVIRLPEVTVLRIIDSS